MEGKRTKVHTKRTLYCVDVDIHHPPTAIARELSATSAGRLVPSHPAGDRVAVYHGFKGFLRVLVFFAPHECEKGVKCKKMASTQ